MKPKQTQRKVLQPLDPQQRYTVEEAADYLRTSRVSVFKLIAAGDLRSIKEGKRRFVPGSEIARRSSIAAAV